MTHQKRSSARARTAVFALLLGGLLAIPAASAEVSLGETLDSPDGFNSVPGCEVRFPLVPGLAGCLVHIICDYIIGCD